MSITKYFRLFANCIPVKGACRSLICDIQRSNIELIPNSMYEVLVNNKCVSYDEILLKYGDENKDTIKEYFAFLIEKEYGFWCYSIEELDQFPDLELVWDRPLLISNMIIDIEYLDVYDMLSLRDQIEELGIPFIQIRIFKPVLFSVISSMLLFFEKTRVENIEIILPYTSEFLLPELIRLAKAHLRLNSIVIYNALSEESGSLLEGATSFRYTKQAFTGKHHCGIIDTKYFSANMYTFTESQKFNSCLNRKISIDTDGQIRNCPSMATSFGNIKETKLKTVIDMDSFRRYWSINKDQIDVCKECEFRYICSDCRAYLQQPADIYSKPLKCGYDPYSGQWKDWTRISASKFGIEYYGLKEIV